MRPTLLKSKTPGDDGISSSLAANNIAGEHVDSNKLDISKITGGHETGNSLGGTGRIFRKACPRLKNILNPEKYSGPQGIRANDQLSSKEVDSSLRISREKYYTSHSENDKTPVT